MEIIRSNNNIEIQVNDRSISQHTVPPERRFSSKEAQQFSQWTASRILWQFYCEHME